MAEGTRGSRGTPFVANPEYPLAAAGGRTTRAEPPIHAQPAAEPRVRPQPQPQQAPRQATGHPAQGAHHAPRPGAQHGVSSHGVQPSAYPSAQAQGRAQPQPQPQHPQAGYPQHAPQAHRPQPPAQPQAGLPRQPQASQPQIHARPQPALDPAHHGYAQPQAQTQAHPAYPQPHVAPAASQAHYPTHAHPTHAQHAHAHPAHAQHAPHRAPEPSPYYGAAPEVAEIDPAGTGTLTRLVNGAGAVMSLALIAGLAVWGYNLAMRDVTDVPVVAALDGAMRVAPENPGGEDAAHQGLAVNNIAGGNAAEGPADQVILAPAAETLTEEDGVIAAEATLAAEASEFRPEEELTAQPAALVTEELVDEPVDTESLIDDLTEEVVAEAEAAAGETLAVVTGPRPRARPADLVARAEAQPSADPLLAATRSAVAEVDAADIPPGTRLVQLGAYDSEDVARAEWDQLAGRFDEFISDKSRVIEKAQSGGKTFYRLRAMGFDDLSDSRRFCAALMAGQAACIPVVTR